MQSLQCGPYAVNLFTGEAGGRVVYTVMDEEDARAVWPLLQEPRPALAAVSGVDWNRELAPWPAPRAFRGADDFGGGGPAFLNVLTGQIVPMVEARLGFAPISRAVAGYSLAGLFALWSVLAGDVFERAASISGSLWFDGFLEYAASAVPRRSVEQIYLSLGDREKNARNPRLATVEDCTRQAVELLRSRGIPVTFELNQGGHFDHPPVRIARGIDALR